MKKLRRYKTNTLFHRTSLTDGFGSIINVAGNYFVFNYFNSGEVADQKAIESDWGMVGDDIREAALKSKSKYLKNNSWACNRFCDRKKKTG